MDTLQRWRPNIVHEASERDPERIYLEPWPYSPEGRLWSEDNVWPLYTWPPEPEGESERASGVEYIRADLHDAEIARLTRELDVARKLIRELVDDEDAGLVWTGTRVVCAYCSATDRYGVEHALDCPIERARRALVADTEGETRAERCRPGQSGGIRVIFGRWPGDETDEEIREWLERES